MITGNNLRKTVGKGLLAILPFSAPAQQFIVSSGAKLVLTPNASLVLNNLDLQANGNFICSPSSNIYFTGGNTVNFGGLSNSFSNIVLAKTGGNVTLNQEFIISGNLSFNGGYFDLNSHTISLGTTGQILNETETSRVIDSAGWGSIKASRQAIANIPDNPGNIGAELTVWGTPGTTVGTYTTTRQYGVFDLGEQESILRSYIIESSAGSLPAGTLYRLRYFYFPEELNGNDPNQLKVWVYSQQFGDDFVDLGQDNFLVDQYVQKENVDRIGYLTLGPDPAGGPAGGSLNNGRQSGLNSPIDPVSSGSIRIFPNPTHDIFTLEMTSPVAARIPFSLYDQSGRLLQQRTVDLAIGINTFTWDLSPYAAGVYFLTWKDQQVRNFKIIRK